MSISRAKGLIILCLKSTSNRKNMPQWFRFMRSENASPYFTFISIGKLVLNYATSSEHTPRIKCNRTVSTRRKACGRAIFFLSFFLSLFLSFFLYLFLSFFTLNSSI